MKETLCVILGGITTALVYLLGGFDIALQCLLIAIALDYISGIIKAFTTKTLSSRIGFNGIVKKLGILLLVMVGVLVDRVSGNTGAIRTLVIYYFVANEGLSIIENLSIAGIPIPSSLKNALKVIRKENNDVMATGKTVQHKSDGEKN
jgi:toxin secretion/phage lysis holin